MRTRLEDGEIVIDGNAATVSKLNAVAEAVRDKEGGAREEVSHEESRVVDLVCGVQAMIRGDNGMLAMDVCEELSSQHMNVCGRSFHKYQFQSSPSS
jgi:hypothetical protein